MMLRDDVEVEVDYLPVDSILVPGYRDLGGVMLGGVLGRFSGCSSQK